MTAHPRFILDRPHAPQIKQRLYNGRKLIVWEGKVNISSIRGWVDNPRIELAKKKIIQRIGNRPLTQEEIFDLMKNDPDVKLRDLRDDLLKNGLREPLTLSFDGKLLDGNRRFFAIKYALESMQGTDPNRQDLETIDAFVLSEDASKEDEQNVLVEENFSASLKLEWPDYVKATRIVDAHLEDDLNIDEIARKFSWSKAKIRETLKINEIIQDFMAYSTSPKDPEDENGGGLDLSENDAETIAAKNYQYFNEAQKSFFDALKTDFDFKIQFFKWINEGKFSSFPEVRIAYGAWKNPEAKAALMQPDPTAAKSAKSILDYNTRILKSSEETIGRIDNFVKFLNEMSAREIEALPQASVDRLEVALGLVIKMNKAASSE
jgi:hypothetical protein